MSGEVDVAELARPIVELLASFGSGEAGGAVEALRETSGVVDGVRSAGRSGVDGMYDSWRGRGGDAAMDKALRVQTSAATVSDHGESMAEVLDRAGGAIAAGQRELAKVLRSFLDSAEGLGAAGAGPSAALVVRSALDHLGRALHVVERVRAELESETAAMRELVAPPPVPPPAAAAATPPAGPAAATRGEPPATIATAVDPGSGGAQQTGSGYAASGGNVLESGAALAGSGLSTVAASVGDSSPHSTARTHRTTPGTRPAGTGVKLTLPDGSTVEAPNQQAADAVRNALSAVGTPYVWGGTTPGVGLDCSGLTQWAYAQAGVSLPRLAQEQGYGHPQVGPGDLMPGDLAVWDGHVAMVIGNGQLVEAGDPVQTGPIRTENMGERFLGFYRPTA
ncbi:C40 family peptidase [Nocardia sp. NBC_01388]|uniref:C40 family peptidase n=1 Tax=Nocardia sp. NBC_01388 TaxID=2903596 RepID=UPI003247C454